MKRIFALSMTTCMLFSLVACNPASSATPEATSGSSSGSATSTESAPIKFTISYADNATLPFTDKWLTVTEVTKRANAEISWDVIPGSEYLQKTSLMLNSNSAPDVMLYTSVRTGELANIALNGGLVAVSDMENLTPHFNKVIKDFKMEEEMESVRLKDGKYYYMPSFYDKPFYDGGLILREDLLTKYNLQAPKTVDDFYNVLSVFKKNNPDSYPLVNLLQTRVTHRMLMPSFGISLGRNAASGNYVLSWDYDKKEYFAGAIDDKYKVFLHYMAKLYAEGLYDPEFVNENDKWASLLATGKSHASYAYYDQIGGLETMSTIEGIKFNLLPPLEGPGGAHHQQKSRIGAGIVFPSTTKKNRSDFDRIVSTVDNMFYSPELSEIWCLGVEGVSYTKNGDKIEFTDAIKNSKNGIYKEMQLSFGAGADPTQQVWVNSREMLKYDENYAKINQIVAAMDDAIQAVPPGAKFDDLQSEEAGILQAKMADAYEKWLDDFVTGRKSIDKEWDTYVKEMKDLGIEKFLKLYNDNL